MITMFVVGFALGAMTVALVLLIILDWQDKKDLENREGRYK